MKLNELYEIKTYWYDSSEDLIRLKEISGRPQDLADIKTLKRLANEKEQTRGVKTLFMNFLMKS